MIKKYILPFIFSLNILSLLLVIVLSFPRKALAGGSKVYIASDKSIVENEINTGDFYTSLGVSASNGKIKFEGNNSYIISKNKARNLKEYGMKNVVLFDSLLKFSSFADYGEFKIGFGLDTIDSQVGEKDSISIEISSDNNHSLFIGVFEYLENGDMKSLYPRMKFGNLLLNTDINFKLDVSTDGYINFYINDVQYLTNKMIDVSCVGYISFESHKENVIYLSDLNIVTYKYETPQNVDFLETFDDGYNANLFYSESEASPITPSSLSVKNGQLVFENTASSYFTTRYMYSNFELIFDLVNLNRTALYNDDGKLISTISTWFGIAFGCDSIDLSASETTRYSTWLQFGRINDGLSYTIPHSDIHYVLWDNNGSYKSLKVQPMKNFNLWDKDFIDDRIVNIKLTLNDGVLNLFYKFDGEEDWGEPYFNYDLGTVKTGYIRFFSWGNTAIERRGLEYNGIGNFAIDNLSLKNTDFDTVKNVIDTPEYKTNLRDRTENFDYTTKLDTDDLLESKIINNDMNNEIDKKSGCNSNIIYFGILYILSIVFIIFHKEVQML